MAKLNKEIQPLPNTLSGMIRIALKDEDRVFKSSKYYIDMSEWHLPPEYGPHENSKVCRVCLAGAVMAGTLGLSLTACETPNSILPDHEADRLASLDYIRTGDVRMALIEGGFIGVEDAMATGEEIRQILGKPPVYRSQRVKPEKRREWRKWMFRCARELEARGL